MIIIGIDTGVKTGFAVNFDGNLIQLKTLGIIVAMAEALEFRSQFAKDMVICIEDTRQRKWMPAKVGNERLKGVGSVNRDSSIWQEFCEFYDLPYILVPPAHLAGLTKMKIERFIEMTGWAGKRPSEHARDAGMMTWKYQRLISKGMVKIPPKPSERTL